MKRRLFLAALAVLVVSLAVPAMWAQEELASGGVCCKAVGGETTYYPMLGKCPPGTVQVDLAECGIVVPTPTPVVVPTVVPTPVPDDEVVPKEVKIPAMFKWLFDFATGIYGKTLLIPAGVSGVLIFLTGVLTRLAPKLEGRWAYACTAALGGIAVLMEVSADGALTSGEYWTTFLAILGIGGGPFLYNFTFGHAKDKAAGK